MAVVFVCDECGKPAKGTFETGTGRALIDGVDNNRQAVELCEEHWPDVESWAGKDYATWQPRNCVHVTFHYSLRRKI